MSKTLHDMTDALKDTANLRAWMGEYPWVTIGASAVGGFFLASALTPTRDESFKERIKSLFPEAPPAPVAAAASGPTQVAQAKAAPAAGGGMMSGLMVHVMDAVKTAIVSTLSAAVTSKVQQEGGNPPENPPRNTGHPATDPTAAAGAS
jgi:hypothetical protein